MNWLQLKRAACWLAILCLVIAAARSAVAQDTTAESHDAGKQPTSTKLLERIGALEEELKRLDVPNPRQVLGRSVDIAFLVETPFLGPTYYGSSNGMRFLSLRLHAVNLSAKEIVISQKDVTLTADGQRIELQDIPAGMSSQGFSVGDKSLSLSTIGQLKELKVAARGTASAWTTFVGLDAGNHVPKLVLEVDVGGNKLSLSINSFARAEMRLTQERLGPHECLALLTVAGPLNSISYGSLVDQLDELAAEHVARVVLRWDENAPVVEPNLMNWLERSVAMLGRMQNNNGQFPQIPNSIREFHLVRHTPKDSNIVSMSSTYTLGQPRIHESDTAAVAVALRTAFQVIPRDELLKYIREGDPLTRSAALTSGGARLASEQLPLVLEYVADPQLQNAALVALRHFEEPEAVEKLVEVAQGKEEGLARTAIESLAASRFASAHLALLKLLQTGQIASKKIIVSVLAEYPQPLWVDAIRKLAEDKNASIQIEALQALARLGHPELLELLGNALKSDDLRKRETAFQLLTSRTDAASEKLALNYALERLQDAPPTTDIVTLLTRTKDERAIPLLLSHLKDDKSGNRSTIINAFGQLADDSIIETLVEIYPKLKNFEQVAVLNVLAQFQSPAFGELAKEALATEDSSLVSSACRGLQMEGSAESVRLLVESLETSKKTSTWSYVCNALSYVGTQDARAALKVASDSRNATKKQYAANALQSLRQRSPAYQHVYQGQHYAKQKDWNTALAHYSLAIGIDSELVEAYVARGNVQIELKALAEARKDFEKARELDDTNSTAVTGLAIVHVLQGNVAEGTKLVEASRTRFPSDPLFAYNAACVYSRALEQVTKEESPAKDAEMLKASYQEKALAGLRAAVKLGFKDLSWMGKDPDLKPLHPLDDFQTIIKPAS